MAKRRSAPESKSPAPAQSSPSQDASLQTGDEFQELPPRVTFGQAMLHPKNRDTLRAIAKFTIVMIGVPLVSFYVTQHITASVLQYEPKYQLVAAGVMATLAVNVVAIWFIASAFSQPDDEEEALARTRRRQQLKG